MAAGKLTSRFGDGNSSVGGSWDRGPFGAATSGFSPGPRFCCFRRHHTLIDSNQVQHANDSSYYRQEITSNCKKYIMARTHFPNDYSIRIFKFFEQFVCFWIKFSQCRLMLGPANSNSDQTIATIFAYDTYAVKACANFILMTRKWVMTKCEIFITLEMWMKIILWNWTVIKATRS